MSSAIPIRNVYYLLCYAWNCLTERKFADVATAGATDLADLFARVLISGVHRLRRRGFERGYEERHEEVPAIRGRIQIFETASRFLDRHARASCVFDELTIDTPQNRVVKAAIRILADVGDLDRDNRAELKRLLREVYEIGDFPLNRSLFRAVRLHANNRHYAFLIHVARLILEFAIPDEKTGQYRFRDFTRERGEMARLFEAFVFNFLQVERPDLNISRDRLQWDASSLTDPELDYLPSMLTDVSARGPGRTVIMDAKYYEQTLQEHYDRKSIHSEHLYQLVSYLRNLEAAGGQDASAEGMLVYPVTGEPLDLTYQIQGHKVRVYTLDLGKDWMAIEKDMKALV